jgi:hypothetical protein
MCRAARILLLSAISLAVVAPAGAAFPRLTTLEWQRVMAGERVVREHEQRRGELDLFGGEVWQRIDAPADVVWDVVVRPELYPQLLPYAVEARPVEDEILIRHRIVLGREASYRLRMERDEAQRILKFWVPPQSEGALRAGWGELQVRALGPERCLVKWTIMADPDLGFLGGLFRGVVRSAMFEVPARIKRYVARRASEPAEHTLFSPSIPAARSGA